MSGQLKGSFYLGELVSLIIETMGYMSLKHQFKSEFLATFESSNEFPEAMKFLILLCVQKSDNSSLDLPALTSSLIFLVLNLSRSEDYVIMIPSHTL
jgi:hypothetical protein